MDEAFTTEELAGMSGMQAMRDRVMRVIGRNPTVRDFLEVTRRGRPREAIVGSGKDIADRLEHWFTERACDGFVIAGTHMPGSFEDFVRFVVPELQRRGPLSQGIYWRDAAGEPRPAGPATRRVAVGDGGLTSCARHSLRSLPASVLAYPAGVQPRLSRIAGRFPKVCQTS